MTGHTHRNVYMTDELQAIYDQTVEFVGKEVTPHGDSWEAAGKVPRDVLQQMGALGMLGLRVPVEHGGLGMGMLASATFSEALGASTYAGFDVTVVTQVEKHGERIRDHGLGLVPVQFPRAATRPIEEVRLLAPPGVSVRFRYFGRQGRTGPRSEWHDSWKDTAKLPLLVEAMMAPADGAVGHTRRLIVAPRIEGLP